MAQIEYEDKIATRDSNLPRKNSVTAEDLNEIKNSVNWLYENPPGPSNDFLWTIELVDNNTVTVYAPFNMKINSIDIVSFNPNIQIQINSIDYVIGDPISAGSAIVFSVSDLSLFNANNTKL